MVVPFKAQHYAWLKPDFPLSTALLREMEYGNNCTVVVDGEVIACGGTIEQWTNRHLAWAYLLPTTARRMALVTRAARTMVERPKGRVEMTIVRGYEMGEKWAAMLGFTLETPVMKSYGPDGQDHSMWTRFN